MKKKVQWRRFLSIMLAAAMIGQNCLTTTAGEIVPVSEVETEAPETQAPETSAPETQAPETSAPETQAPETSAPETQAPETSAPETQAPETSAPETQAPETQAPETQAPETSAPETQAPETSAPETQAPEVTYKVTFEENSDEYGAIWVEDQKVDISTYYMEVKENEEFTFEVETVESYEVDKVTVEGKEVPKTEKENEYEIKEVTKDIEIVVTYKELPVETEVTTEAAEDETEVSSEAESETETELESEVETEIETELESEVESEVESESETELESEIESESETELESESETELQEEEAELVGSVLQSIVQEKDENGTTAAYVNYTISVKNVSESAVAESVSVQALLSGNLTAENRGNETAGMTVYGSAAEIPTEEAVDYGSYAGAAAVAWNDTELAAGESRIYTFTAKVAEGITDTASLQNAWYVNGNAVTATTWAGTENLKIEVTPKTYFTYEDNRVRITAIAEKDANLPENAELKARYIAEGTAEYNEAVALIKSQMQGEDEQFLAYVCYDVYFEADGQEIEPEAGKVRVSMYYKTAEFAEVADMDPSYSTYHIVDGTNEVEDVTGSVNTNSEGEVTSVGFATESFSTVVTVAKIHVESGNKIWYSKYDFGSNWNTCYFYITLDEDETGKKRLGYCLESNKWTPGDKGYDGEHLADIKESVNVQKILYYGYAGPGDLCDTFFNEDYLVKTRDMSESVVNRYKKYFNNGAFRYMLTHIVASKEYYQLDPDNTESQARELAYTGTYDDAKVLLDEYLEFLLEQNHGNPDLSIKIGDTVYSDTDVEETTKDAVTDTVYKLEGGDSTNSISFLVEEGFYCEVIGGSTFASGEIATINAGQSFRIVQNPKASGTKGGIELTNWKSGTIKGAKYDSWDLVIAYSNGNYQDVAGIAYINKASELGFNVQMSIGAAVIEKKDKDTGAPMANVEFKVYTSQEGGDLLTTITTNADGKAYLEATLSGKIQNLDGDYVLWLEETTPDGYKEQSGRISVTISEDANEPNSAPPIYNVYNEKIKIDISGKKIWNDNNDQDGLRNPIIVKLQQYNGSEWVDVAGKTAELSTDDNETYTFTGLPKFNGTTEIQYRVVEVNVPDGYAVSGGTKDYNYDLTNYHALKTSAVFGGTKTLEGRDLKAGEFSFVLTENGKKIEVVTNDKDGNFAFRAIPYTEAGSHTYTVSEEKGSLGGVDYDKTKYTVKVTVVDDEGKLKATVSGIENGISFTNSYYTEAEIELTGTKKLDGRDMTAGEFTFKVTDTAGNEVSTGTNGTDGKITFNKKIKITLDDMKDGEGYAATREFTYKVTEEKGSATGVNYDGKTETVVVLAAYDKTTGTLTLSWKDEKGSAAFTNSYYTEATIGLEGTKTLEGRDMKDGEFTFELKDADGALVATGTNDAEGKITFTPDVKITLEDLKNEDGTYATEKTFDYTLAEKDTGSKGVTYDTATRDLVLNALYSEATGIITLAWAEGSEAPTFANRYTTSADIGLDVTKSLEGRDMAAGEFTFELEDADGKHVATGRNTADGNVTFDKSIVISLADMAKADGSGYEEEKTFTYKLTENKGSKENGVTYDESEKTVTVNAVYNKATGVLSLSLADDSKSLNFSNSYTTSDTVTLSGVKSLNGRDMTAGEFKFEVRDEAGDLVTEGSNNAAGVISFEKKLSYDLSDMKNSEGGYEAEKFFRYTVTEKEGTAEGVTYDTETEITVVVKVTYDKATGVLEAVLDAQSEAISFSNSYTTSDTISLEGTKSLTGRTMDVGEFTFQVKNSAGTVVSDGSNDADGKITFDKEIEITLADMWDETDYAAEKDFHYTVVEVDNEKAGVDYDQAVKNITVHAEYTKADGTLVLSLTDNSDEIAFSNTYEAEGHFNIGGSKLVNGKELNDGQKAALAQKTEFVLSRAEVKDDVVGTYTDVETVKLDSNGKFTFAQVNFDETDAGKTYSYKVVESKTEAAGFDVDTTEYLYLVTVTDNRDATLDVSITDEDGKPAGTSLAVVFDNKYEAKGSATFVGTKELLGKRGAGIGEGEFTFSVLDKDGEKVATGSTAAADRNEVADIVFTVIEYTEADIEQTYTYTVKENGTDTDIMKYDGTEFTVTVKVTDNFDGTLKTEVTYDSEDGIVFTNQYRASGEHAIDNILKVLENSPLAEGQFTFELKDAEGNVLQTKTNDKDGKVTFEALKYTEENIGNTYTYTVSEVNNNVTGVTYDETVYTVKIAVEDSKASDGTLDLDVTTLKGEEELDTMTFTNAFAGSVTLIKKGQDGKVLPGAKFELYAKDAEGKWALYTETVYTTSNEGKISVENLPANDYYFVETEAPKGYVIATEADGSSKQYPFTIGVVDGAAGIVENAAVDASLDVTNAADDKDTTLVVTKVLTHNGKDVVAADETFYVALYEDEACTIRVSEVKPIVFKNESASSVEFTNLKFGKTYYVAETDASGNVITGGILADDGIFAVDFSRGKSAVIEEGAGTQTIIFDNQILTMPSGYYKEGELTITKKLVGADGHEKKSDGVFYAGIFADAKFTQLADCVSENIVELPLSGNSSVSKTVKVSINPVETVTLYVTEVDADGNPVADAADFHYSVKIDGSTVTMNEENMTAYVVITNCEEETAETESEAETTETAKAVKTGDETPVLPFAFAMCASVMLFAVVLAGKRRKEENE